MAEVVDPLTGRAVTVADAQTALAAREGFAQATPEQVAETRLRAEYGGDTGALGALATGALSGATAGLSDVALADLFGQRERLQAYDAIHGGAREVGKLGGMVAGGLLGEGAIGALGGAGARAAESAGLGAWAQLGARGALEGAAYNAGDELARQRIDNTLNGEKLAMALASGGILGGALGAGLGAGAQALGRLGKPTTAGVTSALEAATGGGFWSDAKAWTARISAGMSGKDASVAERFARDGEYFALAKDAENVIADHAGKLTEQADRLAAADAQLAETVGHATQHADAIAHHVADNLPAQYAQFGAVTESAATRVGAMVESGASHFGGQTELKRLVTELEGVQRAEGKGAAMFSALDGRLKPALDSAIGKLSKAEDFASRATLGELRDMRATLVDGLQDVATWGRAADVASELGKAGKFQALAGGEIARGAQAGDAGLRKQLTDRIAHLDNLEKYAALSPEQKAAAEATRASTGEAIASYDKIASAARARDALGSLSGGANGAALHAMMGAAAASGHPMIAGAAAVISKISNPVRTLEGLAMLESIASRVDSKTSGRVAGAIGKGAAKIPGRAVGTLARAAAVAPATLGERRQDFEQRAAAVRKAMTNQELVRQQVAQHTDWMASAAPSAQQAAIATAMRQLSFLHGALPGKGPPQLFGTPSAAHSEIAAWFRKLRAVEKPQTLIEDLESGDLDRDAIDAVKSVYPEFFAQLRTQVATHAAELDAKGKRPSWEMRKQLGLLLGMPTDGTLRPEVMTALQASYWQTEGGQDGAPQPRQSSEAPNIASSFRSGSQATESKGSEV